MSNTSFLFKGHTMNRNVMEMEGKEFGQKQSAAQTSRPLIIH
ncbi:hypothetical protein KP78_20600 [Jeotgalibacillus soli]|uniref:Uncharacterized protein n=1 Tax=Jeotgalibacillus soli TaxID=889306 RepID=A0A0C2VMP1_9BACL|nr:hypothetical protein KP78_20600 [Jeotgalibacillus soli]